ncbi:MmgE/PrpD family protein [Micromonospora sp. AMSO12t]|uniref:MmgE/PrpD family protein n=1 Tax=unclassified Micromonospora TaxID=2617518 RepID=UPI00124BAD95|nr:MULTISPECIES: MmgE/PrpD family protein [unclassified Micromonospora]KAB1152408.1 MmgE/PrpD family protein [Micromonospora sp. AMSO12t]WSG01281.1 MmgE/PrpD family protein [Micromonospora sp. NBC_01740]
MTDATGPTRTQLLARFATTTRDEDIPESVRDYGRLVFLDSLVCGLAAVRLRRSRMVQRVAARFGGPAEATVFGLGQRVAAINAAHANADMMNALDADDTFFNSAHFAVFGVAAGLAEAERLHADGASLLRASILAFEINARLNLSTSLMAFSDGQFRWSPLSSHGYASMGTAAACAVVGGWEPERLTHALGLVAWLAPPAKNSYMAERRSFNAFKYGPYGAIAHAGMLGAALAEEGYTGDLDVLDRTPGFIEAMGFLGGERHEMVAGLGSTWWISETSLKPYPTCRFTHAALDAIRAFPSTHGVPVSQIESMEIRLSPAAYRTLQFREPAPQIPDTLVAPLDGAFNMPYAAALALLGHAPGPQWYDPQRLTDPEVWDLARRITTAPDPVLDAEWEADLREHPGGQIRRTRGALTIRAGGREYVVESDFAQGDPWDSATRADWDFVTGKLATFCDGILDAGTQEQLVEVVRGIEDVADVAETLSPLLARAR